MKNERLFVEAEPGARLSIFAQQEGTNERWHSTEFSSSTTKT
jgi:hypothetical protein